MKHRLNIAVIAMIAIVYVGAIALSLQIRNFSVFDWWQPPGSGSAWKAPRASTIPWGPQGDSIRRGALIFNETPLYAAEFTSSKVACSDCHAAGGMQPYASPMVGLPALFPMFNERAGHMISMPDRIQECFVRSENGKPISYDGPEMKALVDYITWLSQPQPHSKPFKGRGLVKLATLTPDPEHGAQIYAAQCAGCHGGDGGGRLPQFPPLWGAQSFNDGAGMNNIVKMAAFVQHNMPQNRMGILTPQEAYDVAGFIHAQPRPAFNSAYKHF
jgi:thiosulfate dehydrogenase